MSYDQAADNRFWIIIVLALCFTVLAFVAMMAGCTYQTRHAAIAAGLVEGTLPGQPGTYWLRPDGQPVSPSQVP